MENNLVTVANNLINSSYSLTLLEKRFILSLVSKINNNLKGQETLDSRNWYSLTLKEYKECFGEIKFTHLVQGLENLFPKYATLVFPEGYIKVHWIAALEVNKEKKEISIQWPQALIPYISQLCKEFTSYKLKYISNLQSVYSIRLYELLMQYQNRAKRERSFTVEDFKHLLELETEYNLFSNLKNRVIEPAVREINSKTNLLTQVEYIKMGKKVIKLKFVFDKAI